MTPITESLLIPESIHKPRSLRLSLNLRVDCWDRCVFVEHIRDSKKQIEVLHGAKNCAQRMIGYKDSQRIELGIFWDNGHVVGWPVYPRRMEGHYSFTTCVDQAEPSVLLVDISAGKSWCYNRPNGLLIPPWIVPAHNGLVWDYLRLPVTVTGRIKNYKRWPLWRSEWAPHNDPELVGRLKKCKRTRT